MNNECIMAVNCIWPSETEEKKYYHNVTTYTVTTVFNSIYGHLYFVVKTTQTEAKGTACKLIESEEGIPCR